MWSDSRRSDNLGQGASSGAPSELADKTGNSAYKRLGPACCRSHRRGVPESVRLPTNKLMTLKAVTGGRGFESGPRLRSYLLQVAQPTVQVTSCGTSVQTGTVIVRWTGVRTISM